MSGSQTPIGPSPVQEVGGRPFPVGQQGQRWFQYRGLSDSEAQSPANLAALLMGLCADIGRIVVSPNPTQLRQLRGAIRTVRQQVVVGGVSDQSTLLDLLGDYGTGELIEGAYVVPVNEGQAWGWALSRLRWLLRGEALQTLQGLENGPARDALLDALQRLEKQIAHVASRWSTCA